MLRTHAAVALFRARLIGDPFDRQPANYEQSCREVQGDGGVVELEGGLSGNIAHSVDIGQEWRGKGCVSRRTRASVATTCPTTCHV
jgi:hypothetical protein